MSSLLTSISHWRDCIYLDPRVIADVSTLLPTLNGAKLRTTIVSQAAPPMPPPNSSASTSIVEHLHIFYHGHKATPVLPAPTWLQEKGKAVLNAAKGVLKARMPSLGVEVKVDIGDRVEIGLAIVMLESMKTKTVLRADGAGSIKGIESVNQCSHHGNVWGNRR
ncbi:hypothetical protein JB92DRAFT_3154657 [Gautieria morchelliformis]|nr:hypothetical protein JB92DRAFT_3154657 [Gautieria morchelliformis]